MSYAVKLRIATSFLGVAVALALYSLWRIHSEAVRGEISPVSFALLFGGAVVGLAAGISRIYFKIRIKHSKNAEQVGVETLAAAGKQHRKETTRWHS